MITVTDLASTTWAFDLDQDENISVASIAQWYRTHVGDLNNLINQGHYINDSYEIINESGESISEDVASIFKKLYEISYFRKLAKSSLGAAGVDTVLQVQQDGVTVRLADKNANSKNYQELAKESRNELKQLLNNYKYNRSTPRHVETDDRLPNRPPLIVNPLNNASTY